MKLKYITLLVVAVCVVINIFGARAEAEANVNLQLVITPLQCDVMIVNDGSSEMAFVQSNDCLKALKAEFSDTRKPVKSVLFSQ